MSSEPRRVVLTPDAREDLRLLGKQDHALLLGALRVLKLVADRRLTHQRLRYQGKTGDLTDCGKLYFGANQDGDTHRIVVREIGEVFEVIEVVAVEARERDLAYLLAALRVERIEDVVRRSDAGRIVQRLRSRTREL